MHHSIAYRGWTLLWLTRHDTKKLNITIKLKARNIRKETQDVAHAGLTEHAQLRTSRSEKMQEIP